MLDLIAQGVKWPKFIAVESDLDSSMIDAIGVYATELYVQFSNGAWYRAEGAADEYEPMLDADSVGSYWHKNIKKQYPIYEVMTNGDLRLV